MTTFLAMVLAGFNRPSLLDASQRLQLVFTDEFEVSKNHFTTVCESLVLPFRVDLPLAPLLTARARNRGPHRQPSAAQDEPRPLQPADVRCVRSLSAAFTASHPG